MQKKPIYYYVESCGMVYRLTAAAMRKYLRDGKAGSQGNLDNYGKIACVISYSTLDWDQEAFADELARFEARG